MTFNQPSKGFPRNNNIRFYRLNLHLDSLHIIHGWYLYLESLWYFLLENLLKYHISGSWTCSIDAVLQIQMCTKWVRKGCKLRKRTRNETYLLFNLIKIARMARNLLSYPFMLKPSTIFYIWIYKNMPRQLCAMLTVNYDRQRCEPYETYRNWHHHKVYCKSFTKSFHNPPLFHLAYERMPYTYSRCKCQPNWVKDRLKILNFLANAVS